MQYSFTERQYAILQSAGTCIADLDPSYCFAGRSEIYRLTQCVKQ